MAKQAFPGIGGREGGVCCLLTENKDFFSLSLVEVEVFHPRSPQLPAVIFFFHYLRQQPEFSWVFNFLVYPVEWGRVTTHLLPSFFR